MKINNPVKWTTDDSDGTLIARGEVVAQYSQRVFPGDTDWVDQSSIAENESYQWIRISFDGGTTYSIKYRLNLDYQFSFIVDYTSLREVSELEYSYCYSEEISEILFNELKYKSLGIFIQNKSANGVETVMNVLAPIQFRSELQTETDTTKYFIDIYLTDLFVQNYSTKVCYVRY